MAGKRLLLLIILGLSAGLGLLACGDAGSTAQFTSPSPTVEPPAATANNLPTFQPQPRLKGNLTVWSWNIAGRGLAAALASFNRYYPDIKVKIEIKDRLEIYQKVQAGLAAGGTGLPDIMVVENEYLDVFIAKFPEGFANLNDKALKYEKLFDPLKWSEAIIKERVRALPWDLGLAGVFYRVDMFEKAGIDPAKIETWDDFIVAGHRLQAANPGVKLAALDFANDDSLLRLLLSQQDAAYFNKEGQINLASNEAVAALSIIQRLNEAGLILNVKSWNDLVEASKSGQVASQTSGVWWSGTLLQDAPEMAGKWAIMPLPAITRGSPRSGHLGGASLAILKTSKSFEAGWAFLEYNLATAEGQNFLFKHFGLLPSFLPAYNDPFYAAPQPYFNNLPVWKVLPARIPSQKKAIYTGDYDKASKAAAEAQLAVYNGSDPALALKSAAARLEQLTGREQVKANQN